MWKSGGQRRAEIARDGLGRQLVAVAIDADKSSQHALKWAADHVISRGQIFILLHVRRKITTIPTPTGTQLPISEVDADVAATFMEQINNQTKELILPFQCFCSRRGLQCKEVILEDTDVAKAIVGFLTEHYVDKLVMGSSSRNALMRTLKSDVPTSVSKAAPDFCCVYIISKGRISSIRPASNPNKHPTRPHYFETSGNQFQSIKNCQKVKLFNLPKLDQCVEVFNQVHKGLKLSRRASIKFRSPAVNYDSGVDERSITNAQGEAYSDYSYESTVSCPSPSRTCAEHLGSNHPRDHTDAARQSRLLLLLTEKAQIREQKKGFELNREDTETWAVGSRSNSIEDSSVFHKERGRSSFSGGSMVRLCWLISFQHQALEDVESVMRSLKLEMEQRMNLYNNACNEVLNAKQQGNDEMLMTEQVTDEFAEEEKEQWALPETAQAAAQRHRMGEIEKMNISGERKLLQEMIQKKKVLEGLTTDVPYRKYAIEEIQRGTDNFSDELKIGEGGYGPVFRATLDSTASRSRSFGRTPPKAQSNSNKRYRRHCPLLSIEVLGCIRHPNMVLLMGACPEYGCLVYEYMANGSLEDRLFCRSNTPPLPWQLRFRIAAEIATGLLFLHQTKPEPLVHRDLKPGNILLDHNFVSKIADVGLARLVPAAVADAVTQYRLTVAAGTFCYIDPEYQQSGMLGIKSDIYALGIILLQLVTASPPWGSLLDPAVPDWPVRETMAFAKLGLNCAELRKKDRPDLASVVLPQLRNLSERLSRCPWLQGSTTIYPSRSRRLVRELDRRIICIISIDFELTFPN
ncbi:unnamed protein product [Spirodela intermedia]|uniref:RING-type E3 ubiquitin transferase n=1 Tax=Spirodela intermedia TaxID=51605 RepID=A0A7I8J3D0_SPIIN|nr:unnamed protein product [Spirodela intermedia]CAA6664619.1 unnamed protein product [Spirodela intermedia]